MRTTYVLVLLIPISIVLAYSTIQPLKTALDYTLLDNKIVKRMNTTKKEIWDGMVDDIVFYTHSLVNLLGSLEQNVTEEAFEAAVELVQRGKPEFIDQPVQEEKVKEKLDLEEFDLYRFTTLRLDTVNQWNNFESFVNELKDFLRLATDYKQLDDSIVNFIQNPTNEGWEDNLLDMNFYVRSLQSVVRDLDGGVTLGTFNEAEKIMNNGKPSFIDKVVDDDKYITELRIADEQLERFYYMQKFAGLEWEDFCHMVNHKKSMAQLLI